MCQNKIGTDEKKPKNWGALPYRISAESGSEQSESDLPKNMVYPDVQFIAE